VLSSKYDMPRLLGQAERCATFGIHCCVLGLLMLLLLLLLVCGLAGWQA
jgi:hypothetical protein